MIELVIFDLGRVLIRICDDWQHACNIVGIAADLRSALMDEKTQSAAKEIISRYDSGKIDLQQFAREIGPLRGLEPEDVIQINRCFLRGAFPGVDELLDDLQAADVKTACLSNTAEPHWGMVHERGGGNYLPMERLTYRFASHLIGIMKPHEKIYEHVERQTKIPPSHIVFFDDLEENVLAARRRGWNAHVITDREDPLSECRRHLRSHGLRV